MTGEFPTLPDKLVVSIQGIQCSRLGVGSFELILPGGMRVAMSEQWLAKYLQEESQWKVQ